MKTPFPQTIERPSPRTALDDPVAFGHELFSRLTGGIDRVQARLDTTYDAFDQVADELNALVADRPDARALLARLRNMCLEIAGEQYALGIEFGVSSEQLRQTVLAGANGPRIPWNTPDSR